MKTLVIRWVLNAFALFLTAQVIDGITLKGFAAALVAALVLGVINAIIRPIIMFLTLPINFFTLGLFTFVINGFMLYIVAGVVDGFDVTGFWPATIGALVLSIFSGLFSWLVKER